MRTSRVLTVAVAALLLSSCGGSDETRSSVGVDAIVGAWVAKSGARFEFTAGREFRSNGLELDDFLAPGCPTGPASGTWGFYVDEGKSGGLVAVSPQAPSGDRIGVVFEEIRQGDCSISLSVLKGGAALCVSVDLDEVCTFEDRFSRVRPK